MKNTLKKIGDACGRDCLNRVFSCGRDCLNRVNQVGSILFHAMGTIASTWTRTSRPRCGGLHLFHAMGTIASTGRAALVLALLALPAWAHTVTFNMRGHGAQVPSQVVADGGYVVEPTPEPVDAGGEYTFQGWFPESQCINRWAFDTTPVTADMTLFAGWAKKPVRPERPSDDGYAAPTNYNADKNYGVRVYVSANDVFLGNDYLELGMFRNGAFGSEAEAPSNFHRWAEKPWLGLRVSKSGWEDLTGDDPYGTYTRDFFLPGSIDEGWLITVNGTDSVRGKFGCGGYSLNISGTPVVTTKVTGTPGETNETICAKTVVETTEGFQVEQVVTFKKYDTGYDTWVTIRNTTDSDKVNVCYFRAFDPDQPATPEESYTTDNFYHTEENGDVYVMASSVDSELPTYTTLSNMFMKADGAFFFWAPLLDFGYTVTPTTQGVGWNSGSEFSEPDEGYHEYKDTGMSIRFNLGTIPAHGEKTLYYYSSLDPVAMRSLEKLSQKQDRTVPPPVFTSGNVKDEVIWYTPGDTYAPATLASTGSTTGRIYLVTHKCSSLSELADAANQFMPGQACDETGSVSFPTIPAAQRGPLYAYFVDQDEYLSSAVEFYVAPYETFSLTFDANGGAWADGSTTTNVVYTRWTRTEELSVPPELEGFLCGGWAKDREGTQPYAFGERLADNLVIYAIWKPKTGLVVNGGEDIAVSQKGTGWQYYPDYHQLYADYNANDLSISGHTTNTYIYGYAPGYYSPAELNNVTIDLRGMPGATPLYVEERSQIKLTGTNEIWSASGKSPLYVYDGTLYIYGSEDGADALFLHPGTGADAVTLSYADLKLRGGTYNDLVPKSYVDTDAGYAALDNGNGTWTSIRAFTVTFDPKNGDPTTNVIVRYGQKLARPADPVKPGMTFSGWFTDESCAPSTLFDFNAPVTESMTLYAGWGCEATFNAAGGRFEDGSDVKSFVVSGSVTFPTPTRAGYTLLGWYDAITNGATKVVSITGPCTVYARWQTIDTPSGGGSGISGGDNGDGGVTNVVPTAKLPTGDIAIPERIDNTADGKAVVSIARGAYTPKQYETKYSAPAITSVSIPMYVTEIGDYAFYGNTGLKKVVFAPAYDYKTGAKVEVYIRNQAFAKTAVTNVTFPAGGAYKLGQLAFADNAQLKDVWLLGDVTLASLDNTPFRNIGTACGGTTFHLSPKKAADAEFVKALTNGVDMATVEIDEEPAGTVEVTSFDPANDPIVATFTLSADAPWKTVDETTVSLLFSTDPAKLVTASDCTKIPASLVEREADGSYRAEFPKPEGAMGYFVICVGD